MSRVMFSLPDSLIARMKATIPMGERSQLLAKLLEKEVTLREQTLYQHALKLEKNQHLRKGMQEWDQIFFDDGMKYV